jgi:hypothetical protein
LILYFRVEGHEPLHVRGAKKPLVGCYEDQIVAPGAQAPADGER